ncbi:MAG: hypothetical protein R3236_03455, partial [Phycisphaeraceae bacterium]|nr:hypothetical protein [Phycisphaeraceae bacterium]
MSEAEGKDKLLTIFNDEFIEALPEDPLEALNEVCEQFDRVLSSTISVDALSQSAKRDLLIDAYGFLHAFKQQHESALPIEIQLPVLGEPGATDASAIIDVFNKIFQDVRPALKIRHLQDHMERAQSRYVAKLGYELKYHFDADQIEQLKHLIKHLRRRVRTNRDLEPYHQQRLTERLKEMMAAVGPSLENLDTMHGVVIDVAITVGRLGNSASAILKDLQAIAHLIGT